MTTILGVDADTVRVAYCLMRTNKDKFLVEKTGTIVRRTNARKIGIGVFTPTYFKELRGLLYPVLEEDGSIYLEDAFMGRNRKTYGQLSQVQGEIKYETGAVFGMPESLTLVQPSVWQAAVGKYFDVPFRKDMDTKGCSMLCAARILGFMASSTHEADATCIAFYGYMVRTDADNTTEEKEKEAVSPKRKAHIGRGVCTPLQKLRRAQEHKASGAGRGRHV